MSENLHDNGYTIYNNASITIKYCTITLLSVEMFSFKLKVVCVSYTALKGYIKFIYNTTQREN